MEKLLKELLEANRHQRHDFLNHLQVIWGFIKIKREEKAIEYLQEVTDYLQGLRDLNKISHIELVADISAKILSLGLNKGFKICVPEVWDIEDENIPKVRDFLNEFWDKLVKEVLMENAIVTLTLNEGKIVLDVNNVNGEFPWQIFSSIGDKYEIRSLAEDRKLIYFV
ncbi:MAG: hypothetical protein JM58_13390 [Peptococcaceae bacterium BICA1-8]|nr:MAG: hypothetical protein JM58_15820 [Peptococcaceae bacterium BICA1-8]KJS83072.1 MAG: hypothetical protein JM58_13390 [Peptococcaceae bacterium BICA1-8]